MARHLLAMMLKLTEDEADLLVAFAALPPELHRAVVRLVEGLAAGTSTDAVCTSFAHETAVTPSAEHADSPQPLLH